MARYAVLIATLFLAACANSTVVSPIKTVVQAESHLLAMSFLLRPHRASTCSWEVFKPPSPGPNWNLLSGITANGPDDVWVSGAYASPSGAGEIELLHFDGTAWKLIPSAALPQSAILFSIVALSKNDVWGVGESPGSNNEEAALTVHWNGRSWTVVYNPAESQNSVLSAAVGIGHKYVWAVGETTGIVPLIEHFNGREWVMDNVELPSGRAVLQGVAGTSVDNLWAGGYGGSGPGALIERWNPQSQSWTEWPNSIGGYISSMSAHSDSDVWALGPPEEGDPFTERWNGSAWTAIPYIRNIGVVLGEVAAAGEYTWVTGLKGSGNHSFVKRNRGGGWKDMELLQPGRYRTFALAIATVPGSSDIWVAGQYADSSSGPYRNLLERWSCGTDQLDL